MYILIAFFISANPTPGTVPSQRLGSHFKNLVRKPPVKRHGLLSRPNYGQSAPKPNPRFVLRNKKYQLNRLFT
jgi:hypothetical protein